MEPTTPGDDPASLAGMLRTIVARGVYQMPGDVLPYEALGRELAEAVSGFVAAELEKAVAERDTAVAEARAWKRRFCPAGKHYKGSAIQSRRNPDSGLMEPSTFETYVCRDCRQEKLRAECPHNGGISPTRMFLGYGWECSLCHTYFGHIAVPHDEAAALIRAELEAIGATR